MKRINELKNEEIFILQLDLEDKKKRDSQITSTPVKEQSSILDSLFGFKNNSSSNNKELFNPKEFVLDSQRETIKGALFDVIFANWKSKEFGTIGIVLKSPYYLQKTNPTLDEFKIAVQYDRLKNLNQCKGFEITYGIVELNSRFHVVSESLSGGNLRNILLNQNIELSFNQKLNIAFQIANTLMYLHTQEKPLVFSVLKSNLILLNQKMEPKITCTYFIKLSNISNVNSSLPWIYKSPEILYPEENIKYSTEDEIFAFSIILWEIYFRQPLKYLKNLPPKNFRPFCGNSNEEETKENLNDDRIRRDKREIEYISIMKECWNENRNERPTAKNLVYRFGKLLKHN